MRFVLIVVALVGISTVAGAIIVGNNYFDGVVAESPYEKGLKWDSENSLRSASGWNVRVLNRDEIFQGLGKLDVGIFGRNGSAYEGPVAFRLSRSESEDMDRNYTAVRSGRGVYSASVDLPRFGYWNLIVEVSFEGDGIDFNQRLYAKLR